MKDFDFPIQVPIMVINAAQLAAVYAVLAGGVSIPAIASAGAGSKPAPVAEPAPNAVAAAEAPATGDIAGAASVDASELDAGGHPWSEALHASTKGTTKDGYWRMKVGVSRPADLPGFPKASGATGTASAGATSEAPAGASAASAGAVEEDDEFAAFRTAAANGASTDAAAAAAVPARKWTDADLSALCNQAATKTNDPAPIKEVIAAFIPEGTVPHSRNIPDDQREAFAQALEAKVGITFAG